MNGARVAARILYILAAVIFGGTGLLIFTALAPVPVARHFLWLHRFSPYRELKTLIFSRAAGDALTRGNIQEADRLTQRALARAAGRNVWRAIALTPAGAVARARGDFDEAAAVYDEALRLAGNGRAPRSQALVNAALIRWETGRFDEAWNLIEKALQLTAGKHDRIRALVLLDAAAIAMARNDIAGARRFDDEGLTLTVRGWRAKFLVSAAQREMLAGDAVEALRLCEQGLAEATEQPIRASATATLGELALDRRDVEVARRHIDAALEIWRSLGREPEAAYVRVLGGLVDVASGDRDAARAALDQAGLVTLVPMHQRRVEQLRVALEDQPS